MRACCHVGAHAQAQAQLCLSTDSGASLCCLGLAVRQRAMKPFSPGCLQHGGSDPASTFTCAASSVPAVSSEALQRHM